ncbi:hypothetical protein [Paracoccus sp. R86501]|uniref:hypothetical protein n=1 Tax=Paracoccus sp. R86501 TaxID=3101711 RepID=UPI003672D304
MKNATVLVVLGRTAKPADLEPLTETARDRNLHLIVLMLGVMPQIPIYTFGIGESGSFSLPLGWQTEVDEANARLEVLRNQISDYLADQGASAEVRVASGQAAILPGAVSHAALTCDLIVIGDDLRQDAPLFNDVIRAALFRSAGGVMLNAMGSAKALQPASVFVAWKAGIPSARAVHAAMPILRTAKNVERRAVRSGDEQIRRWGKPRLRRGCLADPSGLSCRGPAISKRRRGDRQGHHAAHQGNRWRSDRHGCL